MSWAWGEDEGTTWENATPDVREGFALVRLFWFFRVDSGGPDGSDLDMEVYREASEAAAWFGPVLEERAGAQTPDGGD